MGILVLPCLDMGVVVHNPCVANLLTDFEVGELSKLLQL